VEKGFSLLEVMVAIIVLSIGLLSAAILMANIYSYSLRSRYISMATQLASEELEDLSRWPANYNTTPPFIDPHIMVPAGLDTCGMPNETCIGSITYPVQGSSPATSGMGPVNITANGAATPTPVSYYDTVVLTTQNGQMSESYLNPNSQTQPFGTLTFYSDGTPPTVSYSATPNSAGMTFTRQWMIEQDQPLAGLRRITVLVTLMDMTIQPPVTFQMSMVRP